MRVSVVIALLALLACTHVAAVSPRLASLKASAGTLNPATHRSLVESDAAADMEVATSAEAAAAVTGDASIPKLNNHSYAHASASGMALSFANDKSWMGILASTMANEFNHMEYALAPNVRKAKTADESAKALLALTQRMSYSPVLAAYATLQHMRQCAGSWTAAPSKCAVPLKLEWNVYISQGSASNLAQAFVPRGSAFAVPTAGMKTDILQKQLELKEAPTVVQWLETYGRALLFGQFSAESSKASKMTQAEAIKLGASYLAAPGGVVLNVQSGWSKGADVDAFVKSLKSSYGINVASVQSFVHSQLLGVKAAPVVYLFNSHYGVIDAAEANAIPNGASVAINGGSILREYKSKDRTSWLLDTNEAASLGTAMMNKNLRIGLYVQEAACHSDAAFQLVQYVNNNPTIIKDGFAWGNLNGAANTMASGDCRGEQSKQISADGVKLLANRAKRGVSGVFGKK